MADYRVTKYDPTGGRASDWTSVSDVGKTVSLADYARVEDAYVAAVRAFLDAQRVTALRVVDLERRGDVPAGLEEGSTVEGGALDALVRLALREVLWCRLEGPDGFFVHFGYDYYMYIGGDAVGPAPPLPAGMFAERFRSPYRREA